MASEAYQPPGHLLDQQTEERVVDVEVVLLASRCELRLLGGGRGDQLRGEWRSKRWAYPPRRSYRGRLRPGCRWCGPAAGVRSPAVRCRDRSGREPGPAGPGPPSLRREPQHGRRRDRLRRRSHAEPRVRVRRSAARQVVHARAAAPDAAGAADPDERRGRVPVREPGERRPQAFAFGAASRTVAGWDAADVGAARAPAGRARVSVRTVARAVARGRRYAWACASAAPAGGGWCRCSHP